MEVRGWEMEVEGWEMEVKGWNMEVEVWKHEVKGWKNFGGDFWESFDYAQDDRIECLIYLSSSI